MPLAITLEALREAQEELSRLGAIFESLNLRITHVNA